MGWSCVIISTINQRQHPQELLSNVLPFINTLCFGLNVHTSKSQRLVNVFILNPISASTFPTQAMKLQVTSSRRQDHCKNPQYGYFHVHCLWHCKFANYLRIVRDILGTQQERATWPPVRLGNQYRISKPPPQQEYYSPKIAFLAPKLWCPPLAQRKKLFNQL
jgi:hypothetical protein